MTKANDLSDELQIRNLLARLAHAADTASEEELEEKYLDCFTDDAIWEARQSKGAPYTLVRRGKDDIRNGAVERRRTKRQGPGSKSLHVIMASSVKIDGDTASSTSCFQVFGQVDTQPSLKNAGRYHDTFRRENGAWRIASRLITDP